MFCFRLIFVTSKYGRNRALVQPCFGATVFWCNLPHKNVRWHASFILKFKCRLPLAHAHGIDNGRRAGPDVSCMQYVQVQGGMEMLKALLALLTVPVESVVNFVTRTCSAGALQHPLLAVLPAAEQHAIATWLLSAQPDDPLLIITNWNAVRLLLLGSSQDAVVKLLQANGAHATACMNCLFFRGPVDLSHCQLALKTTAPQLFGFSTPAEQQALTREMDIGGDPPRVADTITVYSVSKRTVEIKSLAQFFAV